jgi:hypothetical protein
MLGRIALPLHRNSGGRRFDIGQVPSRQRHIDRSDILLDAMQFGPIWTAAAWSKP